MSPWPMDPAQLIRAGARHARIAAGEPVFLEGEPGNVLYLVLTGKVHILSFGRVLEDVGPGGLFGEMTLIDAAPRSAAALAAVDCEVLTLDRETVLAVVSAEPEMALHILGVLAARLRASGAGA